MRLIKEFITASDVVPPPEELIHEANDREELVRVAEAFAREISEASDAVWHISELGGYRASLNVSKHFHLVIKP